MDLKLKDQKLLISLFLDSRKSNRQIAKEIGIAKETVSSRIEYFEEIGIIKSFSLKTNYEKLDFMEYNLYIRLKNINPCLLEKIITFLNNHKNTTWIGKTFGRYDLRVSLIIKEHIELTHVISDINKEFSKNIEKIDYVYVIDKFKASSRLFLENIFGEKIVDEFDFTQKSKKAEKDDKIDQIDKTIIYELSQNPKLSYAMIANIVDLTPEGVSYKVKRLEENNYITGHSIVIDGNKFSKIWCVVLLNINTFKIDEFKKYLKEKRFLSNYAQTIGVYNFTANLFANNIEELYLSLNEIRNNFGEDISNFEFLINFDFYKFPKLPRCIVEK